MSEEGRAVPAQKSLGPAETLPDIGPPPVVTAMQPSDKEERKPAPGTLLAPVAALPGDDDDAGAASGSSREPLTGARRRGRLALRIPDDEVVRPLEGRGVARPRLPSTPDAGWNDIPTGAPSPVEVPISEEGREESEGRFDGPPASPAVTVTPMRIIAIEAQPRDEFEDPPPEPAPSVVTLDSEDEIRFEDELGAGDRASEPGDELAMEVVEEPPRAELPPMRPRTVSNPPAPPPPTRRPSPPSPAPPPPAPTSTAPVPPAMVSGVAAPQAPASKPPLVIVPPQLGNISLQPADASGMRRKGRLWWEDLFNDDYLRTVEKLTDEQIAREVSFIEDRLGIERGGSLLDLACGTGRHAIELARRGYEVVGFDLSLAMLARAGDEAQEREVKINFVQGDMREMSFDEQFDGVYCWGTSFGYFEEEKNAAVVERIRRSLRSGGLLLLDVVNRDFLVRQSPSLAWFEGDGCVCMDEMNVDFITSRMKVKRTMMLDDGRSREIEYSMRVYSLHELGKILHDQGFKVCEVSGRIATPGVFFGNESPRTIVLAEKR